MNTQLAELKKYLIQKKVFRDSYGIGELPSFEGYCLLEIGGEFEIFYFERGQKQGVQNYFDVNEAIRKFKVMVLTDPSTRKVT
jgi:hypothetical protein